MVLVVSEETRVLRRIGYLLAFGAAAAGLAVTAWPGASANPATPVNRFDVIAAPVLLAAAGWAGRMVFGPAGLSRRARGIRAAGYAAVFALVVVEARAERSEYGAWRGASWLAGLWVGEIGFLLATAAYLAALTAGQPGRRPGNGRDGGSRGPVPPPPPPGGRRLDGENRPAVLPTPLPPDPEDAAADRREKVPVGAASPRW
jgi:hypothetical protein